MRILVLTIVISVMNHMALGKEKQIQLEDIEQDTLVGETKGIEPQNHLQQPGSQITYSNNPRGYSHQESPAEIRAQIYHLPKVHEADQTYTVPAKQTLVRPIIGGSQPIQPVLAPQPQYIYIPSPHGHQTQYMPQTQAYVAYARYSPQHAASQVQLQQIAQLPSTTSSIYSYPHATPFHQSTYHEYEAKVPLITPLQTSVDYTAPHTIVHKKTLPSVLQTSFQQYYSPGLEYHYSEASPVTKISPQSSYSYHQTPSFNYHTNSYYRTGLPSYGKHQSNGLLELVTYTRQQQLSPVQNQYDHQYVSSQTPQQLITPAQSTSYLPHSSAQSYNTIQYSVSLPSYDHSKRSISKATASISVKTQKSD